MSLNTVRAGLSTRFATITGLRCHDTIPATINPPTCFIGSMTRQPAEDMSGHWTATFEVFVCLSKVEEARNVEVLDDYADSTGSKSVEAALDADPDLNGVANSAALLQVQSPVNVEVGGVTYTAAQFTVEVYA